MLSCLPGLTSGSTMNWTPGSGSTDSAGSTGSFSDGSVTIMHEWDARISMMPWLCKKCYAWNEMHALVWYPILCKGDKTCIMNGTYAMMHKHNTRDDKQSVSYTRTEKLDQELANNLYRKQKSQIKLNIQRTLQGTHENWFCSKSIFL